MVYNNIRGFKEKETSVKWIKEEEKPETMILLETFLEETTTSKIEEKEYKALGYGMIRLGKKQKYGGGIIISKQKLKNILTLEKEYKNQMRSAG